MKKCRFSLLLVITIFFAACAVKGSKRPAEETQVVTMDLIALSDDSLLTLIQKQTFDYFREGAEPNSGMSP